MVKLGLNKKEKLLQKINLKRRILDVIYISFGIFLASVGLKAFLLPNGFIDGGITGISLLAAKVTHIPLSFLLILINLPFIILGYKTINRYFAIKTFLAILGLSIVIFFVSYPVITTDRLLTAIFGGFFLGAGVGLAVRGGAVIDGTEIFALYLTKKVSFTIGDIILLINIIIFSLASFFLGIEAALYSIITYFAASKTVDFIIFGIEEYTGVTIVSNKTEEIRLLIIEKLGRGVTIYRGKRGFGKRGHPLNETDVIFTVLTRLEVTNLKSEIEKIDSSAFLVMNTINEVKGGMIKKRPLSH
ncbi:MAG: YitT family protein [Candidatus Margulisiibacteriota bacterium]|jgi:uncharacterized membrane-anchored protein YitT (DUF2179 family)